MQKNLLSGSTERTNAGVLYFPNSVTQEGINIVEEILDDPLFGDLEPPIDLGFTGKRYCFTKYIKTHPIADLDEKEQEQGHGDENMQEKSGQPRQTALEVEQRADPEPPRDVRIEGVQAEPEYGAVD